MEHLEILSGAALTIPEESTLDITGVTATNSGTAQCGGCVVSGGTAGTDYVYKDGTLFVVTGITLTISIAKGVKETDDVIAVTQSAGIVDLILNSVVYIKAGTVAQLHPTKPTGFSTEDSDSWKDIQDEIADAEDGDTITIDMGDKTGAFEKIAGKGVEIDLATSDGR